MESTPDWLGVGVFVGIISLVLALSGLTYNAMENGHEDYLKKLEVCKTIEDPSLRTICVRGTG